MHQKHKLIFGPLALGICAAPTHEALAQFSGYLKIPGIAGESTVKGYESTIDILSFRQNVAQPGGGLPTFQFSKLQDKSSPLLYSYCAGGSNISSMLFTIRTPSGTAGEIMTYTFQNVAITNVQTAGTAGTDLRPTDSFVVLFQGMTWSYTPVNSSGVAGAAVVTSWTNSPPP